MSLLLKLGVFVPGSAAGSRHIDAGAVASVRAAIGGPAIRGYRGVPKTIRRYSEMSPWRSRFIEIACPDLTRDHGQRAGHVARWNPSPIGDGFRGQVVTPCRASPLNFRLATMGICQREEFYFLPKLPFDTPIPWCNCAGRGRNLYRAVSQKSRRSSVGAGRAPILLGADLNFVWQDA